MSRREIDVRVIKCPTFKGRGKERESPSGKMYNGDGEL